MGQWGLHERCCDWMLGIFSRPKTAYGTAEDSRSLAQLHFSEWESKSYSRRTKYSWRWSARSNNKLLLLLQEELDHLTSKQQAARTSSRVRFLSGGLKHLRVSTALVVQIFTASQTLDQCTLQFPAQEDQLGIITKQKRTQGIQSNKSATSWKNMFFWDLKLKEGGARILVYNNNYLFGKNKQRERERERENVVGIEQLPTKKIVWEGSKTKETRMQ